MQLTQLLPSFRSSDKTQLSSGDTILNSSIIFGEKGPCTHVKTYLYLQAPRPDGSGELELHERVLLERVALKGVSGV